MSFSRSRGDKAKFDEQKSQTQKGNKLKQKKNLRNPNTKKLTNPIFIRNTKDGAHSKPAD